MKNKTLFLILILLILSGGGVIAANVFFHEEVGIGTSTPQAMLDVAGGMKISDDADSCSASKEGTIRYNTTDDAFEGCDGTEWRLLMREDSVPNNFSFTDQTGVNHSTLITSNIVSISGITVSVIATVTGDGNPNVRACSDSACNTVTQNWGTSASVSNGQYLQVRLTSNSVNASTSSATVAIEGVSDVWSVTTRTIVGEGEVCTENADCSNNSCLTIYPDTDGDAYGDPAGGVSKCYTSAPAGYTANNTDCYDSNADVHPGQTTRFTTHRGDGSFDYNCDGTISANYNEICEPSAWTWPSMGYYLSGGTCYSWASVPVIWTANLRAATESDCGGTAYRYSGAPAGMVYSDSNCTNQIGDQYCIDITPLSCR